MQDNRTLSKGDLLKKLKEISAAYKATLEIEKKVKKFEPTDNYERTVKVPNFPGDFLDEDYFDAKGVDREAVDELVDPSDKYACAKRVKEWKSRQHALARKGDIENIAKEYDLAKKPKGPKKPKEPQKPNHEKARAVNERILSGNGASSKTNVKQKPGCLTIGCGIVAIAVLLGGGLFEDDAFSVIFNLVLLIACGAGIAYNISLDKQMKKRSEEDRKREAAASLKRLDEEDEKYEQDMKAYQEALVVYEQRMKAYQEALAVHEQNKAAFIQEYTQWRDICLAHLEEEERIAKQLEADRIAGQEKIQAEEYVPAKARLEACNDLLAKKYLPHTDDLINLLKNGRADNLKEAINQYEEAKKLEEEAQNRCECCQFYDDCELAFNPPTICVSYRPKTYE